MNSGQLRHQKHMVEAISRRGQPVAKPRRLPYSMVFG
jgi:hypothetical protein